MFAAPLQMPEMPYAPRVTPGGEGRRGTGFAPDNASASCARIVRTLTLKPRSRSVLRASGPPPPRGGLPGSLRGRSRACALTCPRGGCVPYFAYEAPRAYGATAVRPLRPDPARPAGTGSF